MIFQCMSCHSIWTVWMCVSLAWLFYYLYNHIPFIFICIYIYVYSSMAQDNLQIEFTPFFVSKLKFVHYLFRSKI